LGINNKKQKFMSTGVKIVLTIVSLLVLGFIGSVLKSAGSGGGFLFIIEIILIVVIWSAKAPKKEKEETEEEKEEL
jgi:cation transporter-like permease